VKGGNSEGRLELVVVEPKNAGLGAAMVAKRAVTMLAEYQGLGLRPGREIRGSARGNHAVICAFDGDALGGRDD